MKAASSSSTNGVAIGEVQLVAGLRTDEVDRLGAVERHHGRNRLREANRCPEPERRPHRKAHHGHPLRGVFGSLLDEFGRAQNQPSQVVGVGVGEVLFRQLGHLEHRSQIEVRNEHGEALVGDPVGQAPEEGRQAPP